MKPTTVVVIGGCGQVGRQIATAMLEEEGEDANFRLHVIDIVPEERVAEVTGQLGAGARARVTGERLNVFFPAEFGHCRTFKEICAAGGRERLIQDLSAPRSYVVVKDYGLVKSLARFNTHTLLPEIIVIDAVNTATVLGHNLSSGHRIRWRVEGMDDGLDRLELHEGTILREGSLYLQLYLTQLAVVLRWSNVVKFIKVSTTATGGFGVNIPYTHSEFRDSKEMLPDALMGKNLTAGMLHEGLHLLNRTPGIRGKIHVIIPSALVIGQGGPVVMPIHRNGGEPLSTYDADTPVPVRPVPFGQLIKEVQVTRGDIFTMPVIPTGENGAFGAVEFAAITMKDQMEVLSAARIASACVDMIEGRRCESELRMEGDHVSFQLRRDLLVELNAFNGAPSVTTGVLGPWVSKMAAEAELFSRVVESYGDITRPRCRPEVAVTQMIGLLMADDPLRVHLLSAGCTILLPDNAILTTPNALYPSAEECCSEQNVQRWAQTAWVNLTPDYWEEWLRKAQRILDLGLVHPDAKIRAGKLLGLWMCANGGSRRHVFGA